MSDQPVRDSWISNEDFPAPETEPVALPEGRVLVAVVNQHRLECRTGGKVHWTTTADARITHPPVVHEGTAFVGASDGWVYAVDLATGARRWRTLVAPGWRRIVAYGQMESAWPVRRLAIHQGLVCASAGRHPELDGGIRVAGLDPATGTERWQGTIAYASPDTWFSIDIKRKGDDRHLQWLTNGGL
jgi:outer membrane protein assembly factor BamB